MILSMTGFGAASLEEGPYRVSVELRTQNHRYLKLNLRLPSALSGLETELEAIIRQHVRRGAVAATVRYKDDGAVPSYRVDVEAARSYRTQISELRRSLNLDHDSCDSIEPLLGLPGVIRPETDDDLGPRVSEEGRVLVCTALKNALESLVDSRRQEGSNLARVLVEHGSTLERHVLTVSERATEVPREQRDRVHERVQTLVAEIDPNVEISESDLIRELCLIAERTDVAEELNRLKSHLDRYRAILAAGGETGKKLDFLLQEMLRETNTIGSKANDPTIAHSVVDMKCEVERMKEQVQNVE